MTTEFDDIRPYTDEEIPSAMSRIASSQMFSAWTMNGYLFASNS